MSNLEGGTDRIMDALDENEISIVAKEVDTDAEGLASTASKFMDRKGFDLLVCVPDNPSGAGIALNKYNGIRAVVCASQSDIEEALSNKANAIIFKNMGARDMQGVLGYLMSRHETATATPAAPAQRSRQQPRQQVQEQPRQQPQQPRQPLFKAPSFRMPEIPKLSMPAQKAREEPVQEKERQMPDRQQKGKKKGMLERLKDELGIIDG
ncbi:MAG: hypothetical protein KGH69_03770 [Candidatus Micrarchaeota archaeon]|nr:hypothetical protein [Candidatus Micrarchaeota archaeon]